MAGAGLAAGVAGLATDTRRAAEAMESRLLAVAGAGDFLAGDFLADLAADLTLSALLTALFLTLLGCVYYTCWSWGLGGGVYSVVGRPAGRSTLFFSAPR